MGFEAETGTMSSVGVGMRDCGDCVWLTSDPDVVTARDRGRALAESLGFSAVDQASVETTISELAINMLTYARSGEIRLEVVSDAGSTGLRIVARDWGSKVDSLGFSDVQRLTDDFQIHTRTGRGTVVTVTKWLHSAKPSAA
jgi:serine/threonine-protein kinase RsbT